MIEWNKAHSATRKANAMKKPPAGVQFVDVQTSFQKQASQAGGVAEADALAAAQDVVETMEEAYLDELAEDMKALAALADKMRQSGGAGSMEGFADEIYATVKKIRDLGETFGYLLVTEIGDLFCELIYRQKFAGNFVIVECQTCIEALKLVSRQAFKGKTVSDAPEICAGIAKIVDKHPKPDKSM